MRLHVERWAVKHLLSNLVGLGSSIGWDSDYPGGIYIYLL
jgi:hypothetical protein